MTTQTTTNSPQTAPDGGNPNLAALPDVMPPAGAWPVIEATLDRGRPAAVRRRPRARLRWWQPAAVAAVLVAAVAGLTNLWTGSPGAGVDPRLVDRTLRTPDALLQRSQLLESEVQRRFQSDFRWNGTERGLIYRIADVDSRYSTPEADPKLRRALLEQRVMLMESLVHARDTGGRMVRAAY